MEILNTTSDRREDTSYSFSAGLLSQQALSTFLRNTKIAEGSNGVFISIANRIALKSMPVVGLNEVCYFDSDVIPHRVRCEILSHLALALILLSAISENIFTQTEADFKYVFDFLFDSLLAELYTDGQLYPIILNANDRSSYEFIYNLVLPKIQEIKERRHKGAYTGEVQVHPKFMLLGNEDEDRFTLPDVLNTVKRVCCLVIDVLMGVNKVDKKKA